METNKFQDRKIERLTMAIEELQEIRKEQIKKAPHQKQNYYQIRDFIKKNGFTQDMKDVFMGYEDKYINEFRIAHSTEIILSNCYAAVRELYEEGYRY